MITKAMVIAAGAILPTLDLLFVGTRIYIKLGRAGKLGWDDFFIILTMLLMIGYGVMAIYGAVVLGYGSISTYVVKTGQLNADSSDLLVATKHLTAASQSMTTWVFGTAKLSVLFFLRTIFYGKVFNILSTVVIMIVCVWTVTGFLFLLLQCGTNVHFMWTSAKNIAQHCLSGYKNGFSISVFDVFTDLLILILPMYWVYRLHMPTRKKAWIAGVFLFGLITIGTSALRMAELALVYPSRNQNPNQFDYLTNIIFFNVIEGGMCVIAACLPTLGPLLSKSGRKSLRSKNKYKMTDSLRKAMAWNSPRGKSRKTPNRTNVSATMASELNFMPKDSYYKHIGTETTATGHRKPSGDETTIDDEERGIRVMTDVEHKVSDRSSQSSTAELHKPVQPEESYKSRM